MNFKEILGKIVTYNDIKSAPPSSDSTFLKYMLWVKAWIFFR